MKKSHRAGTLAALVAAVLVLSCLTPLQALAEPADTLWTDDGVRAASFASRDDAAKTIEISTPAELALLAYEVNVNKQTFAGYTLTLADDIDLAGHVWDPIGYGEGDSFEASAPSSFQGTFDGAGHTICNMTISAPLDTSMECYGLFGSIFKGTVRNLSMSDSSIDIPSTSTDGLLVGTVAGKAYGTTFSQCAIAGTSMSVSLSQSDMMSIGGLAGATYNCGSFDTGSCTGVVARGISITAEHDHPNPFTSACGGLVGFSNQFYYLYANCCACDVTFNAGNVTEQASLIGSANAAGLTNCYGQAGLPLYNSVDSNTEANCSLVDGNGVLADSVTINGTQYSSVVEAFNAWNSANGFASVQLDCEQLGVAHRWEVTAKDAAGHSIVCDVCGTKRTEAHSGGAATCVDQGICSICGEPYGPDPSIHASLVHVPAVAPTTESAGNIEYYVCEDCGRFFSDAAGTQPLSADEVVLPALTAPSDPDAGDAGQSTGGDGTDGLASDSGHSGAGNGHASSQDSDVLLATGDSAAWCIGALSLVGFGALVLGRSMRQRG